MVTLTLSDTDLMLLELAVQELPEKARFGLGTKINQQIMAQQEEAKANAKAEEEADEPRSR